MKCTHEMPDGSECGAQLTERRLSKRKPNTMLCVCRDGHNRTITRHDTTQKGKYVYTQGRCGRLPVFAKTERLQINKRVYPQDAARIRAAGWKNASEYIDYILSIDILPRP